MVQMLPFREHKAKKANKDQLLDCIPTDADAMTAKNILTKSTVRKNHNTSILI
jgi:hypothetical protein